MNRTQWDSVCWLIAASLLAAPASYGVAVDLLPEGPEWTVTIEQDLVVIDGYSGMSYSEIGAAIIEQGGQLDLTLRNSQPLAYTLTVTGDLGRSGPVEGPPHQVVYAYTDFDRDGWERLFESEYEAVAETRSGILPPGVHPSLVVAGWSVEAYVNDYGSELDPEDMEPASIYCEVTLHMELRPISTPDTGNPLWLVGFAMLGMAFVRRASSKTV